ncbi:hypothetical protein EJ03DRAFT_326439 [Teratosphaeria nubilosa]|uniref:Fatty acid hydroxylase domain-containing protein n=1 Tax=Teratosphaeria nubilosa TaxID=161662 RepID=A0A6G1LD83_9PEZI|nr:hypothetical protein EJ03DRAFT_326439 [Teratosphaeria nubilosa]
MAVTHISQTQTQPAPATQEASGRQMPSQTMGGAKNPMKSTWRTWDKSQWRLHHYLCDWLNIHPTDQGREVPVHQKTDTMPYLPHLEGHKWILAHALWPLVLHQVILYLTGWQTLSWGWIFLGYTIAFKINAIHEIHTLRELGHQYGFLDGDKHARDQIPDRDVGSVFHSLSSTSTIRPMMSVFLAYRRAQTPVSTFTRNTLPTFLPHNTASLIAWNTAIVALEIGLYGIVLDFFFYWYHRIMHESNYLWKFHRKHHMTKHPNPLLSLYADTEQEIFDIAIVPIATFLTLKYGFQLPMGFYEWWLCHQYVVFTELWGHSGLRVWTTPPTTATWFLRLWDAELITEDHDLHHRKGWKSSHNYGKQTRLWDVAFGSMCDRIEQVEENVDRERAIRMNLFGAPTLY